MQKQCTVCLEFFDGHKHKKTCSPTCAHKAQAVVVRRIMLENNPMKCPSVAEKMSKTRSKRFRDDPVFKEKVAAYTRKAWADGKYDGVRVGQCVWYEHTKLDGTVVKLQGTWEVVFAQFLDTLKIEYKTHHGRIPYVDDAGIKRSYYPDFYIPMWNAYIDVKGAMFYDLQLDKMRCVRSSNADKFIEIVTQQYFNSIGLDVCKLSSEYLNLINMKDKK